ncbi:MAG: hypothetical protein K6B70_01905 [Clostridia bacterium]|nr:hypothetical protein [Clostridia bacterium]
MPKFVKQYDDPIQLLMIRNGQRRRYYQQTAQKYPRRAWNSKEDELVLNSNLKDMELSEVLKRSVESIQVRRCKLLKEKNK